MKRINRISITAVVLLLMCVVQIASAEAGVVIVGPRVWAPRPYYYPYPYYAYPPPVVVRQPEVYVQEPAVSAEPNYWYFCKESQGYYPYVKQCPSGWLKVVPSAPKQANPPPAP